MCCDGTLFDLVRLEPGDDARRLARLGLPIAPGRGRQRGVRLLKRGGVGQERELARAARSQRVFVGGDHDGAGRTHVGAGDEPRVRQ
jgi:hypothetical protein